MKKPRRREGTEEKISPCFCVSVVQGIGLHLPDGIRRIKILSQFMEVR